MPLDAITLRAEVRELSELLAGGKIDRVAQPEKDELVLALRTREGNRRLVVSASPNHARIHLTDSNKENPAAPPMFCMLLRKYIVGARILGVEQEGLERMAFLRLLANDEMGEQSEIRLVCELMGRHSNIILVGSDGRILDCLKRVDGEMSEKRQVLPGMIYRLPPAQDKRDLLAEKRADVAERVMAAPEGMRMDKLVLQTWFGLSPLVARELAYLAAGEADALLGPEGGPRREKLAFQVSKLADRVRQGSFEPTLLYDGKTGIPTDFSFFEIHQYGTHYASRGCASFSALLDEYYTKRDNAERMAQRSSEMLKVIANSHDRISRKLALQQEELSQTAGREAVREQADILGAFAPQIPRGAKSVVLPNLYAEEGRTLEIALDERLTPQQNIQRYYKNYNRMKKAEAALTSQIEEGKSELAYLDSVFDELSRAQSPKDLEEIREELAETGYLSKKNRDRTGQGSGKGGKKRPPEQKLRAMLFTAPSGLAVSVGRNNRQNDLLTLKSSSKSDLWFHTQKIPGSHVVLSTGGKPADEESVEYAASLAAFYSKARASDRVSVDYTLVKNVKKPPGAKPGMVIYDKFKTVFVKPREK